MFSVAILFVVGVVLLYLVVKGLSNKLPDETTGDSGVYGTDLYKSTKAAVDSEFKVEEPTPINPAIVDDLVESDPSSVAPKPKKKAAAKKPAAKKKTSKKKSD